MAVAIVPVAQADKPALWARLQDYIREMTAHVDIAPEPDGTYAYAYFDLYWTEENRFAYWAVTPDGARVAFALVRTGEHTEMAEFYSFPEFRRSGTAMDFARQLLARFPGPWTLSEFATNHGAIAFWRKAIASYPYTERSYTGDSGKARLEQRFTVPG